MIVDRAGIRRNVTFPFVPGHEPSGVIARVGPGVVHFRESDEVICQPSGYCGYCRHYGSSRGLFRG